MQTECSSPVLWNGLWQKPIQFFMKIKETKRKETFAVQRLGNRNVWYYRCRSRTCRHDGCAVCAARGQICIVAGAGKRWGADYVFSACGKLSRDQGSQRHWIFRHACRSGSRSRCGSRGRKCDIRIARGRLYSGQDRVWIIRGTHPDRCHGRSAQKTRSEGRGRACGCRRIVLCCVWRRLF